MTEFKQEIPIFFSIDDSYAPYLHVALISMIENASKENKYKIFVLYEGVTEENIKNLALLENENFEINFIEMKHGLESITDRKENRLRCDYFTMTIYFRLFISEMFPQFDKGIYIDSDIVVPGDISKLYNLDLGDNIIGACQDHSVENIEPFAYYIENYIGVSRYKYINSGVLLMNLKKMREKGFTAHFLNLMNTYHFNSVAPDQDYINAICKDKILYLDESWDAMPTEGKEPIKNVQLIHYNLFDKPWCYDDIQYEEYFWKYAKKSVYYDFIVHFKENYPPNQRESDAACLNEMVTSAVNMTDNEVGFEKVYESGVRVRL